MVISCIYHHIIIDASIVCTKYNQSQAIGKRYTHKWRMVGRMDGCRDKSESLFVLTKAVNNYFPWLRHFIIMAFAKGPACPSWCRKSLLDLTPPVSLQSLSSLCLDTQIMLWLFCVWVCVFSKYFVNEIFINNVTIQISSLYRRHMTSSNLSPVSTFHHKIFHLKAFNRTNRHTSTRAKLKYWLTKPKASPRPASNKSVINVKHLQHPDMDGFHKRPVAYDTNIYCH